MDNDNNGNNNENNNNEIKNNDNKIVLQLLYLNIIKML